MKLGSKRNFHKFVSPVLATASIGVTYYLINVWKESLFTQPGLEVPEVEDVPAATPEGSGAPSDAPVSEGTDGQQDTQSGASDHSSGSSGNSLSSQSPNPSSSDTTISGGTPQTSDASTKQSSGDDTTQEISSPSSSSSSATSVDSTGEGTGVTEPKKFDLEQQYKLLVNSIKAGRNTIWNSKDDSIYAAFSRNRIIERGLPIAKGYASLKKKSS